MVDAVYRIDIPDGDEYRLEVYDPASPYGPSGKRVMGATMFKFANDLGKEVLEAKEENAAAIAQSEKMVEVVKKLQAATPETWDEIEAEVVAVMTEAGLADRLPGLQAELTMDIYGDVAGGGTGVIASITRQGAWPPLQLEAAKYGNADAPFDAVGLDVPFEMLVTPLPPPAPPPPPPDINVYVTYPQTPLGALFPPRKAYVTNVGEITYRTPDASQLADMASALQNAANLKAQTDTNYAATLSSMLTTYSLLVQAAIAAYQSLAEDQRDQLRKTSS